MANDIPEQEQIRKWFRSHLLGREVELQELYELEQAELVELLVSGHDCIRQEMLAVLQELGERQGESPVDRALLGVELVGLLQEELVRPRNLRQLPSL